MTPTLFTASPDAMLCTGDATFSPLVLADRLITLAQHADRAGLTRSAARLIGLVYAVLDEEEGNTAAA